MTRDELIMRYYDGELDEPERVEVLELAERDPQARALLAELELLGALVQEATRAKAESVDLTSAIMVRVEAEAARTPSPGPQPVPLARPRRKNPVRPLVAVATGLALAASVALLVTHYRASPDPSASAKLAQEVAAPAAALPAPEPEPPEQSVAIERIDFGEDPGAIFLVPGADDHTVVVWTMDPASDDDEEIQL